jgi:hypothetical protein
VSLARSVTALLGFLAGAAVGGRIMAGAVVQLRAASSVFALEIVFLVGATLAALGYSVVFISAFPTALRDDRFHSHSDGDEKCRRT